MACFHQSFPLDSSDLPVVPRVENTVDSLDSPAFHPPVAGSGGFFRTGCGIQAGKQNRLRNGKAAAEYSAAASETRAPARRDGKGFGGKNLNSKTATPVGASEKWEISSIGARGAGFSMVKVF
jgi:hypothetical protein